MKSGVIFGAWDLFHAGHLRVLQAAAKHCHYLYVGVFSDAIIKEYKGRAPIMSLENRMVIFNYIYFPNCKCKLIPFSVNYREPVVWYIYDYLFVSEQLKGKELAMIDKNSHGKIIYLPYTQGISTTEIKKRILHQGCVCKCG